MYGALSRTKRYLILVAVIGVSSVAVGISGTSKDHDFTTGFFVMAGLEVAAISAFAAMSQAEAADAQAAAARAQTLVSHAQLKMSIRPVLTLEKSNDEDHYERGYGTIRVRNVGSGTAFKIRYWFVLWMQGQNPEVIADQRDLTDSCLPSSVVTNVTKPAAMAQIENKLVTLEIEFADALGNSYYSTYHFHNWRDGGYTPYYFEGNRAQFVKSS